MSNNFGNVPADGSSRKGPMIISVMPDGRAYTTDGKPFEGIRAPSPPPAAATPYSPAVTEALSSQPIVYDRAGNSLTYAGDGKLYDHTGKAVPLVPMVYDSQGKPLSFTPDGKIESSDGSPYGRPDPSSALAAALECKPELYDAQGKSVIQGADGKLYDHNGKPIPLDKNDMPIVYDAQGRPLTFTPDGKILTLFGKPYEGSPSGWEAVLATKPNVYDSHGYPLTYGSDGKLYDRSGRQAPLDANGLPIIFDAQGRPSTFTPDGKTKLIAPLGKDYGTSSSTAALAKALASKPKLYDAQGKPLSRGPDGKLYDIFGRPAPQYDNGMPVVYDPQGRPLYFTPEGIVFPDGEIYREAEDLPAAPPADLCGSSRK